jgi:hypothetical protein
MMDIFQNHKEAENCLPRLTAYGASVRSVVLKDFREIDG